jgi:hypothetical protein
MIDTQQYIKLNIHGEVSIIVVQAHSGRKRDICTYTYTHIHTELYTRYFIFQIRAPGGHDDER